MTKREAYKLFKEVYSYLWEEKADYWRAQEMWSYFTDSLCKDGRITDKQFSTWSTPFEYGKTLGVKSPVKRKPRVVVKTEYGTYKITSVAMSRYRADNSLAIELWCDDGPFARLTVCLLDKLKENESYVDTNNCPWAEDFIREYKLGEIVGYKASGYCLYPKVAFDLDRLRNVF